MAPLTFVLCYLTMETETVALAAFAVTTRNLFTPTRPLFTQTEYVEDLVTLVVAGKLT